MKFYNNAEALIVEAHETGFYNTNLGKVPVSSCEIAIFPNGMLGFEGLTDYFFAPLPNQQEENSPFKILQSLQANNICFITMQLQLEDEAYICLNDIVPIASQKGIDVKDISVYLVVSIDRSTGETQTSVNLKAPVLFHKPTQNAWQVVLDRPDYPLNYRLT